MLSSILTGLRVSGERSVWVAQDGWEPSRVLMIGDAMTDFEAARKNGLQFIGRQMPSQPTVFPPGTRCVLDLVEVARAASELYSAKPVTAGVS